MKKIAVIGSSSLDWVVTSSKRPMAGETVLGDHLKRSREERNRTRQLTPIVLEQKFIW